MFLESEHVSDIEIKLLGVLVRNSLMDKHYKLVYSQRILLWTIARTSKHKPVKKFAPAKGPFSLEILRLAINISGYGLN